MMDNFKPGDFSNPTLMNNQAELADEFMIKLAQAELSPEEQSEFEDILGGADEPGGEEEDPNAVDQEDAELPDIDTDASEMESISNLIPWDSFVIIFDPHYSKLLEETNGLPPAKAKAKSYYIYFSPENKRLEGVVNKRYIGGYGTKDLGEDFSFLKTLSEEGFAPEWKDLLLTDIDELPAVMNEKTKENLRESNDEVDENARKEEDVLDDDGQDPALNDPVESAEDAGPAPQGNVGDTSGLPMAAKVNDIKMRRQARNSILNELS